MELELGVAGVLGVIIVVDVVAVGVTTFGLDSGGAWVG